MLLSKVFSHCQSIRTPQLRRNVTHSWEIFRTIVADSSKVERRSKPARIITPRRNKPLVLSKKTPSAKDGVHEQLSNSKEPPYVEIDPHNSRFVRLMTCVKTRKQRYVNNMIMLEGKRLIQDALTADVEPLMIVFNRKHLIEDLTLDPSYIQPENTIFHHLSYRHIKTWSDLKNSPGIFGLFRMPNLERNTPTVDPLPITLVCDNIREPGNLGSILRVAAAVPVAKVFLLSGCTDLWDTKVTRGSCGAMFHLQIFTNASWEDVEDHCSGNVILADHENEVTDEKLDEILVDGVVPAENYIEDPEEIFDEDNDNDDNTVNLRTVYNLPLKPYYGVSYANNNNSYVIVIGGETQGLSEESFKYASAKNGVRVNIPLPATVNSLNSATALGIISFEIKRQLEVSS